VKLLLVSLWAISDASVGGTERFTIDLADALTSAGHTVEVLMLSGKSTAIHGIPYRSLNIMGDSSEADEYTLEQRFGKINSPSVLEKIGRYLESNYEVEQYDAIQLNSLLFLSAWVGRRRIFTIHTNPYEFDLNWGAGNFDFICHWVSGTNPPSTIFTAPSRTYANLYSGRLNQPVAYIPHAIQPERIRSDTVSPDQLRARYKIGDGAVVLMPSRLDMTQKRPQLALEALITAKDSLPEFVAVFTGVDSHYAKNIETLTRRAQDHGIATRFIRFDQMADAYQLADLVILPSRSESFGYSALEALSVPRRAVLSHIPPYQDIAEGNPNAYIAEDTPESFAHAIVAATASPVLDTPVEWTSRYAMGSWAKRYVDLARELVHG
jgi:glycosyltransferase involved in cell wall biosynthesis